MSENTENFDFIGAGEGAAPVDGFLAAQDEYVNGVMDAKEEERPAAAPSSPAPKRGRKPKVKEQEPESGQVRAVRIDEETSTLMGLYLKLARKTGPAMTQAELVSEAVRRYMKSANPSAYRKASEIVRILTEED